MVANDDKLEIIFDPSQMFLQIFTICKHYFRSQKNLNSENIFGFKIIVLKYCLKYDVTE